MIKPNAIESHLKANYRFMHIGLVQVAIKPLLKNWSKCSNLFSFA